MHRINTRCLALICFLSIFGSYDQILCSQEKTAENPDQKRDSKLIQGNWKLVFLNDANRRLITPEQAENFKITWEFGEKTIIQTNSTGRRTEQPYQLDPSRSPATIDCAEGLGIYEFEGDLLRIIVGRKRPNDFRPDLGSENLFVLKLVKPKFELPRPPERKANKESKPVASKVIDLKSFLPASVVWLNDEVIAVGGLNQSPENSLRSAIVLVGIKTGKELSRTLINEKRAEQPPPGNLVIVSGNWNRKMLAVSDGRRTSIWSVSDKFQIKRNKSFASGELLSVCFSNDGKQLITGASSPSGTSGVWDIDTGELTQKLKVLSGCAADFNSDSKMFATAEHHNRVHLFDSSTGKQLAEVHAMMGPLYNATFSTDNSRLFVGGEGGIKSWKLETEDMAWKFSNELEFEGVRGSIRSISLSPDNKYLASNSSYPTNVVTLSDASNGRRLHSIPQSRGPSWSSDGKVLATITNSYATYRNPEIRMQIRLWEAKQVTGREKVGGTK